MSLSQNEINAIQKGDMVVCTQTLTIGSDDIYVEDKKYQIDRVDKKDNSSLTEYLIVNDGTVGNFFYAIKGDYSTQEYNFADYFTF